MRNCVFFLIFSLVVSSFATESTIRKIRSFKIRGRIASSFSYVEKENNNTILHPWFLVTPVRNIPSTKYPLKIVLHSNGNSAEETMLKSFKAGTFHDSVLQQGYTVYIDSTKLGRDHWWGARYIADNPQIFGSKLHPAEERVLGTVDWLKKNYPIDENKIHLYGISMGGSGAIGIGINHGHVFATISVVVPARFDHGLFRIDNPGIKDPVAPPLFVYVSHLDRHEMHPDRLALAFDSAKMHLSFIWGPQGHDPNLNILAVDSVTDFQQSIRRDAAYPAFFKVTHNSKYPGFNQTKTGAQFGYINAQFRWKILTDSQKTFSALVWLEPMAKKYNPAEKQTADLLFRRLQVYKDGESKCRLVQSGKTIKSVVVKDQKDCLQSIEISRVPVEIHFSKM